MARDVEDFTPGGVFQGTNINFTVAESSVTPSSSSSTDKYVASASWDESSETLTLTYNDSTTTSVVLDGTTGGGGGGTDTNTFVQSGTFDSGTSIVTFTRNDDSTFEVDLSALVAEDDVNNYVSSINLSDNVLTLEREGLGSLTQSLSVFDQVDNQTSGTRQFTIDGFTYTVTTENVLTVTTADAPVPAFSPMENNPEPANALETDSVEFPAVEANEGFTIADVEVTDVAIIDTEGNSVSTDLDNVTVNSDNSITVDVSEIDDAISEIDLTVEVTDNEGDVQTLEPEAQLYIPYYTLISATELAASTTPQQFSEISNADESSEEIGSTVTITNSANVMTGGTPATRAYYYIMANGTHSFSQNGFALETPIVNSGSIGAYSFNIYDLGQFGNPFQAAVAPDITVNVN